MASNREWASRITKDDPEYFSNLQKGQSPRILWLGCSDSRVPETTILGVKPGDVFVHRNIANILPATDLSSTAVIEFATAGLGVQHIVVCGHTGCGGVDAALGNKRIGKIDTWLQPLRQLRLQNADMLEKLEGLERNKALVELNVKQGVETLRQNPDVIDAVKSRGLQVHGIVFDLSCGELKDVETSESSSLFEKRAAAFATS